MLRTVGVFSLWMMFCICVFSCASIFAQDTIIDPYRITKPFRKQELTPWDSIAAVAYQKHLKEIDSLQLLTIKERIQNARTDTSIKTLVIDRCFILS